MSEKKKDSLYEKKIEELNFTSEEINDQVCAIIKMKRKKKLVKKQKVEKKENAESDLIVIEDDSLKQKQKKKISNRRGCR